MIVFIYEKNIFITIFMLLGIMFNTICAQSLKKRIATVYMLSAHWAT